MSHAIRRASELALDETTVTALRAALKTTADEVVQAIIDEVPPYANALSGRIEAGLRFEDFPLLLCWSRPFADFGRYVPISPGLP